MTLIEQVAQLRELERKATPPEWIRNGTALVNERGRYVNSFDDLLLIIALRNAAPALLSVLEAFQEGDVTEISHTIAYLEYHAKNYNRQDIALPILRRLAEAAAKMEAQEDK